jgi:hypothetical protein
MTAPAIKLPALSTVPVYDGQRCIGHILHHGPDGVEAFNLADESLGLFPDESEAAAALWRHTRGQPVKTASETQHMCPTRTNG